MTLGELKRLNTKEVWADEARDFTPWLAENLGRLGEVLSLDLELTGREAAVGDFSCDLLARDVGTKRIVIIENQFGPTSHDHLGKILTYAAGLDAEAIIWVAEKIRDEHRQTLEWLNRHTDKQIGFFGVVVEVLRIDNSSPAVNFKALVSPNEWQPPPPPPGERSEAYRAYFQALIDELREKHRFTNARVGPPQNWYNFGSGVSGADYGANFAQAGRVRVELYINVGDTNTNKAFFDCLYTKKREFENGFGEPLSWERLDERIASRVALYRPGSINSNPEELNRIRQWMVEELLRFRSIFGPKLSDCLQSIRIRPQSSSSLLSEEPV
jgi:hypothetical protein